MVDFDHHTISHRSQHILEADLQKSLCCSANADLYSVALRGWIVNSGPRCNNCHSPSPRFCFATDYIKGIFKANILVNLTPHKTDTSPLGTRQTIENYFVQDTQLAHYQQLLVVKNTGSSQCQQTFENLLYLLQGLNNYS